MKINKPIWLDTTIGILGIVITVFASMNLSGLFDSFELNLLINYLSLALGLLIIIIIIIKSQSSTKLKKINKYKLFKVLEKVDRTYNKLIIYNPTSNCPNLKDLIVHFNKLDFNISISGESSQLISIYNLFRNEDKLHKYLNVLSYSHDLMGIFILGKNRNKIILSFLSGNDALIIKIQESKLANELSTLFDNVDLNFSKSINLQNISNPPNFLSLIETERKKYIDNFNNLKSGYISFHGSEVLNIQSGWIESGNFKTIRTIDLTTDPSVLLTRHRYNKANKEFIANGGVIKRVYVINKHYLEDSFFFDNLKAAVNLQTKLGVIVGIQIAEDLSPKYKQDFILYDNFAVLVEEKQANSDYSFGKSTAYFSSDIIIKYEKMFNRIWEGKSLNQNAIEQLNALKLNYEN